MKALTAVARAKSALGQKCIYKLGKGGFNPNSPHPWNSAGELDCSGFVSWCLGVSRHTDNPWYEGQNGGWIETSAILRDALSPYGMFEKTENPRHGDVIVYGDSGGKQGHVGLVMTDGNIIHCSSGNYRSTGDAIGIAKPELWLKRGGIYAMFALVTR